MAEKKKNKKFTTPKGVALFPRIVEPDMTFVKEGTYSVKLRLTEEEAQPLIDLMDKAIEDAYQNALDDAKTVRDKKKVKYCEDKPYKEEEDEDGNPTGHIVFNFKMKASGIDAKTGKPWKRTCPIFDAKGKPVPREGLKVWSGTVMRVSFYMYPFFTAKLGAGVSLKLLAVQILELVEGGADAGVYGFEEDADASFSADSVSNDSFDDGGVGTDPDEDDEDIEGDF